MAEGIIYTGKKFLWSKIRWKTERRRCSHLNSKMPRSCKILLQGCILKKRAWKQCYFCMTSLPVCSLEKGRTVNTVYLREKQESSALWQLGADTILSEGTDLRAFHPLSTQLLSLSLPLPRFTPVPLDATAGPEAGLRGTDVSWGSQGGTDKSRSGSAPFWRALPILLCHHCLLSAGFMSFSSFLPGWGSPSQPVPPWLFKYPSQKSAQLKPSKDFLQKLNYTLEYDLSSGDGIWYNLEFEVMLYHVTFVLPVAPLVLLTSV